MDTHKLLTERGSDYGDTHIIVGKIIALIEQPFVKMVLEYPELVHDYVLMLSKVIRIVFNPFKLDSYDDLIGYTALAKDIIERKYYQHDTTDVSRSEHGSTTTDS